MTPQTKLLPHLLDAAGNVVHIFGYDRVKAAERVASRKGLRLEMREGKTMGSAGRDFGAMKRHSDEVSGLRGETDATEAGL